MAPGSCVKRTTGLRVSIRLLLTSTTSLDQLRPRFLVEVLRRFSAELRSRCLSTEAQGSDVLQRKSRGHY